MNIIFKQLIIFIVWSYYNLFKYFYCAFRLFSFVTVINNVLMNIFGYKVTVRAPGCFKQVVRCEVTVHRHSIPEVLH